MGLQHGMVSLHRSAWRASGALLTWRPAMMTAKQVTINPAASAVVPPGLSCAALARLHLSPWNPAACGRT